MLFKLTSRVNPALALIFIILASILLKLLIIDYEIANGDEAVFGIMAKHISELKEFPIYLWKAHYAGTLNSYIGAFLFKIFGISGLVYRFSAFFFFIPLVFVIYHLGKNILNEELGLISAIFIAIPPSLINYFSIFVGGVYLEGLFFGSLIFLLALLILFPENFIKSRLNLFFVLGLVSGIGLWLSPQVIPFFISVLILFFIKDRKFFVSKNFLILIISFFIGYLPALIYNFKYPLATFYRFSGRILNLDHSFLYESHPVKIILSKIIWRISIIPISFIKIPKLLLSIIGIDNFSKKFIFASVLLVYLFSWLYIFFLEKKFVKALFTFNFSNVNLRPIHLLVVFVSVFITFYSFLVGEDSPRYLLPMYIPISIFLSMFLLKIKSKSKIIFLTLWLFILNVNFFSNFKALNSQNISYDKLISFLSKNKIFYGYSDYFTAYPIIFNSGENIIISPTAFDNFFDRYPAYTQKVNNQQKIAYIFNTISYPLKNYKFEEKLENLKIKYKRECIYPFVIYYDFSQKVSPQELKLI